VRRVWRYFLFAWGALSVVLTLLSLATLSDQINTLAGWLPVLEPFLESRKAGVTLGLLSLAAWGFLYVLLLWPRDAGTVDAETPLEIVHDATLTCVQNDNWPAPGQPRGNGHQQRRVRVINHSVHLHLEEVKLVVEEILPGGAPFLPAPLRWCNDVLLNLLSRFALQPLADAERMAPTPRSRPVTEVG